ncbi:imm11 family protein [Archangium violaceum]|uniref:imm11 family protein n=1 Tax=Archangium violaceum TaxID=83451 RepID=UPI0037C0EA5D
MRYFDLFSNMRIPGRWVLGDPVDEQGQEIDPWQFREGRHLDLRGPLRFLQVHPGCALDFSIAGSAIPVVHGRVVSVFERLKLQQQVQFLPAQVEGESGPYFVLNVLRIIRCIDDARCEEVLYWKPEDGRPDKVGQYRNVAGLRIDPSLVGDAHIFRPWGWRVVLIVSDNLKQALEQEGLTGLKFTEV